jgi:hypothetical protein
LDNQISFFNQKIIFQHFYLKTPNKHHYNANKSIYQLKTLINLSKNTKSIRTKSHLSAPISFFFWKMEGKHTLMKLSSQLTQKITFLVIEMWPTNEIFFISPISIFFSQTHGLIINKIKFWTKINFLKNIRMATYFSMFYIMVFSFLTLSCTAI